MAERLASYEFGRPRGTTESPGADAELVERAATLLLVMPPYQSRDTIAELLAPHNPELGHQAVRALIDAQLATEDSLGRLRRVS